MCRIVNKAFDELTTRELYALLKARAEVFVVEQSCVYQDLDNVDLHSRHVMLLKGGNICAYLRVFMKDAKSRTAAIGRVLTLKRGVGLGKRCMEEGIRCAKEELGAATVLIEAQVYAIGFYEKLGFKVCSEEFLEDGIPHAKMILELS